MTQPLSADVQRLSTPSGPGNIRTPVRPNAPARRPTDLSRQNSLVIDLTDDALEEEMGSHPAKRRRLEEPDGREEMIQGGRTPISKDSGHQERRLMQMTRQRPPQSFAALLNQTKQGNPTGQETRGKASTKQNPPPLPIRPWNHKAPQPDNGGGANPSGMHVLRDYGTVQATAFHLDAPSDAPHYREGRVADFLPWSGNHSEDVMNENTAKQGYYDRQISQNETGTARPSLYSIFKHKSGLEVLSSLFARAVEERKAHGKISSASNFKPPPRVTLTEAKRKAWLNDLANADVPLRKLSRTIPQGIRGQQLLDQTLINSVPVGRAVWFAKCVGANEIRTLKRKGTSGTVVAGAELKWLREWTGGVSSFFNDIVSSCGQENWKGRMSYALNIVTRLYQENMLDKDCFIEWLTTSLSKSKLDMLPVWLTVSRSFLEDIVRLRRYGRIMSEALLQKLEEVHSQDTEDFVPLIKTLSQLVRAFAHSRPLLFLMPQQWTDYEESFKACLDLEKDGDRTLFANLGKHNLDTKVVRDQSALEVTSTKQKVLGILDAARAPFEVEAISQSCLDECSDHDLLIDVTVAWAATPFRTCNSRKYLCINLLRRWHEKGINVDEPIKDILLDQASPPLWDWDIFFHITSDLVRSQTISISRFLQMAIARGAIKADRTPQSEVFRSPVLRMVEEAPMVNMPVHVKNLRHNLLKRAGVSVENEQYWIIAEQTKLCEKLPSLFGGVEYALSQNEASSATTRRSRCAQLEVARWILNHVAKRKSDVSKLSRHKAATTHEAGSLAYDEFVRVRATLEELDDIPILADVLRHTCISEDENTLTAIIETLNAHHKEFSAIGALEPLSTLIFGQYLKLRASSPARALTISLLDLVDNTQTLVANRRQLLEDLARGDKNIVIAACSPISDYMAENLQQAGQSFIDEFDQLLSTGNIMDDQAMSRLFHTLAERTEASSKAKQDDLISLCHMLFRLMAFRPKQYEQLLLKWLKRLLQNHQPDILTLLMGTGVVSLEDIMATSSEFTLTPDSADTSRMKDKVQRTLLSLLETSTALEALQQDSIVYRLKYCRSQCLSSTRQDVIQAVGTIRNSKLARSELVASKDSWEIRHLLEHPLPGLPNSRKAMENVAAIVSEVLGISADLSENSSMISSIVRIHDPCSLPFRVSLLSTFYDSIRPQLGDSGSQGQASQMLFEAIQEATQKDMSCLSLISGLGVEVMRNIRQRAEEAFLAIPPPYGAPPERDQAAKSRQTLMDIVAKTSFTVPENGIMSTLSTVSERFQALLRFISIQVQQQAVEGSEQVLIWSDELGDYVCQLLRLINIHRPSFASPSTASSQSQAQLVVRMLLLLTSLALHPSLQDLTSVLPDQPIQSLAALPNKIFNTAALLSDGLAEEPRVVLARHLKDKMRDLNARFLFGSLNSDVDSLSTQDDLIITREKVEGKEQLSAEYKVKNWELIQAINAGGAAGSTSNDTGMSLSLFQGRIITSKNY